jgi:hypothetical protein
MLAEDLKLGSWVGSTGGADRILGGDSENLTGGPTTRMFPQVVCCTDFTVSRAIICECRSVA